jgi:hypothetical protein
MPIEQGAQAQSARKLRLILDADTPLCREDVVWALDYIKKKVADEDSALAELSQPRLLKNYRGFAEAATSLLASPRTGPLEADRIRNMLREALYGLDRRS